MFKKAFTLIELLVVVAVIAILTVILVPVVTSAIEDTERTVCSNNLKVIGKAYYDYAQANESDPFPRHIDAPTTAANVHQAAGLGGADTLVTMADNAMQTAWVLIAQGLLPASAFKCPGDDGYTERVITNKYGWGTTTEFSYGVHYPYADNGAGTPVLNPADPADTYAADDATTEPPAKKGDNMYLSNWIIMADRNPGGAVGSGTPAVEHSNHLGSKGGSSVVTKIGNVSFYQQETSSMAGFGDDIYTDSTPVATNAAFPQSRSDTLISPTVSR